ncbi:MAG: hypothetical protein J6R83_04080 [Clostridia bacterium]|nr:hypothetical protein [Clostridia bacterium]
MKATSIKQIKFNRGQVSDLLSERVDMGLQNACGTVYDNTYINRYGQLEEAPTIKLASNGRSNTQTKIITMFDTGEDWVLPVGVDYSSTVVNYYGWIYTPYIVARIRTGFSGHTSWDKVKTLTCYRAPSADYTEDGVTYYAWTFGATFKSSQQLVGYTLTIDYVYTTTPNPTTSSAFTAHISSMNYTGSFGAPVVKYGASAITSVSARQTIYTKLTTPTTGSDVFDNSLTQIGSAYSGSADSVIYNGATYYRDSTIDTSRGNTLQLCVYSPVSKSDNSITTDLSTPVATAGLTKDVGTKIYQFGYNCVVYDQNTKPILFNIIKGANGWHTPVLTLKETYFDGAFYNIYLRGLNQDTPSGFTPPTSGEYRISGQDAITTEKIVTVKRNSAGSAFIQDLVGQVINAKGGGGALQVRTVEDGDTLTAYVLSPISGGTGGGYIPLGFSYNQTEWVFGYEKAYGDTAGPNGVPSYPDSVIYVNQRLVFGGNDYRGNLIAASRIGVLNDFEPETSTESDAFTTAIAAKDYCRIVDFVVSNNELRIACTNGEYAMSLANLNPTSSLNGFDLRSEVGIAVGTPICDCGGITAYVSDDGDAVYGTQFSLLKDRYQPISLTSQTDNVVNDCKQLVYLVNRRNQEGNLLVGLNADGSLFGMELDTNAGLVGAFMMLGYGLDVPDSMNIQIVKLMSVGYALWGLIRISKFDEPGYMTYIVRFARHEFFNFTTGLTMPTDLAQFINKDGIFFRGLLSTTTGHELVTAETVTDNGDGTSTVSFGADKDGFLFTAGFLRQADWRSVEVSVGMATRELNKHVVKLEGVIKPQEFWNYTHTETETISVEDFGKFFNLVNTPNVTPVDSQFANELPLDIYGENGSIIWRRAFDNLSREKFFGFTTIAPFLVKSLCATIEYDEVA